jgi:plastocyanin
MRKLIVLVTAIVALAAAPQALAATVGVSITRAGFVPQTVNVRVGDTVTWTNNDTITHQVVSTQCNFSSPVLQPGQAFSRTFTAAARCAYEDPLQRPRLRGTVVVAAAPASVSIAARPTVVTYGRAATLSGRLSTGEAGERVTVAAQACGGTFARVADVTTTTGGAWSLVVRPANNTVYRVSWRNNEATTVVRVRPAATLRKLANHRWSLRVRAGVSLSGRVATVQRFNATTRRWVRIRLVTLRRVGTAATPFPNTIISGRVFRAPVRARTRVRVVLPQAQVTSCYAATTSNTVIR